MRLGLMLGYSGKHIELPLDLVKQAEAMGFESVWLSEAYGSDAISPAAWILSKTEKIKVGTAIMQVPARTPAMAAMSAMTLNQLSGGRFIMGLGASGPQVVEGWHGVPYGKPLTRLREYIEVLRKIMAREGPVEHDGEFYQMPCQGPGAVGLGKPLKSILAADTSIPIYTASITPKGLQLSAEIADGVFPIWQDPEDFSVLKQDLDQGFAKAGAGKDLSAFDVAPFVMGVMDDNLDACRDFCRPHLALYIGGMGAKGKNFYTAYATRMGYGEAAQKIQDLYLAGDKAAAQQAVPNELIDAVSLVGPAERIRERLQVWKQAGQRGEVGTMILGAAQPELLQLVANEVL